MKHLLAALILVHECVSKFLNWLWFGKYVHLKLTSWSNLGRKSFVLYNQNFLDLFVVFFGKTKHEIDGWLNIKFF